MKKMCQHAGGKTKLKMVVEYVAHPVYICSKCLRVADQKDRLCFPEKLKALKDDEISEKKKHREKKSLKEKKEARKKEKEQRKKERLKARKEEKKAGKKRKQEENEEFPEIEWVPFKTVKTLVNRKKAYKGIRNNKLRRIIEMDKNSQGKKGGL